MQRIDTFLVERELVGSREQAKRLILAGAVTVNGTPHVKPGQRIPLDAEVNVAEPERYVSRGGLKLEKALRVFDMNVEGQIALDVGASTGGFTDCLLQHGVQFVYAVDVGYGQLAWKLRRDPRVQPIEKMNIRDMTPERFRAVRVKGAASLAVIDVSFISLRTVLPGVLKLLPDEAGGSRNVIALLKPQFEAGRVHVKKGGIVSDPEVHVQTIDALVYFATEKLGVRLAGLTYSPIRKQIGNIEYLLRFTCEAGDRCRDETERVVADARAYFETED